MTESPKTTSLSEKAKQAEAISKQYTEDIKIAAEAMERTIRHRKAQVFKNKQYGYERIF
jgi:hypothetical protein